MTPSTTRASGPSPRTTLVGAVEARSADTGDSFAFRDRGSHRDGPVPAAGRRRPHVTGRQASAQRRERRLLRPGRRRWPAGNAGCTSSPASGSDRSGGEPGIPPAPRSRPAGRRSSPTGLRCTGGGRRRAASRDGWSSTIRPAYITSTRSVASSTTPRSWLISTAVNFCSRCRSLIVFITARCTITSRAVVGSSKTISLGSRASASAIATRWRIPPDSSCGKRPSTSASSSTLAEQLGATLAHRGLRVLLAVTGVRLQDVGEVVVDVAHRVQRVHAALQDEGEAVASLLAQLLAAQAGDVGAVERDAAALQPGRRPQHPGQGEAERGLAAPGLPHQADELALVRGRGRRRAPTRCVGRATARRRR